MVFGCCCVDLCGAVYKRLIEHALAIVPGVTDTLCRITMPNLRKIIVYLLAAAIVLWAGNWLVKRVKPAYAKWRLTRAIAKIEPWPATTNYSPAAWKQLVRAARVFQETDPELAGRLLAEHIRKYSGQPAQLAIEEGKMFLLLHMVFDIAEDSNEKEATAAPQPTSPLGTVHGPSWPIQWRNGQPSLVSGHPQSKLFLQPITDEFTLMRYRYKYRDLSKVKF